MRILSVSDAPVTFLYSPSIRARFRDVDLIVGCGDLPYYYLEYIYNALDVPLVFVRGNHDKVVEYGAAGQRTAPQGCIDIHRRARNVKGVLIAGVEGSPRYRPGPFQYSQSEMWGHVLYLAPRLMLNRLRHGRALDIFVTHATPAGVHEGDDYPHRGIQAFRWLNRVFRPAIHLHGHVHIYSPDQPVETCVGSTRVINTFRYQEVMLER